MLQYLANKRHYQRFDLIDALVAENPTKIKLLSNSWARASQTWEVLVMLLGNTFHPVATLFTFTQTTSSSHSFLTLPLPRAEPQGTNLHSGYEAGFKKSSTSWASSCKGMLARCSSLASSCSPPSPSASSPSSWRTRSRSCGLRRVAG